MPAAVSDTAVLSVSFAVANGWLWSVRPARVTVSSPTGPDANVPVVESPYCRRTSDPVLLNVEDVVYGVEVELRHTLLVQASLFTHRSLEPVSIFRA